MQNETIKYKQISSFPFNGEFVRVTRTSILSGKLHTVIMHIDFNIFCDALKAWEDGAYIQDAFPMLSDNEREFMLSGITAVEWDKEFEASGNECGEHQDTELNNPEVL